MTIKLRDLFGVAADPFGDGADGYAAGAFGLPGFGVLTSWRAVARTRAPTLPRK
jgi:hypothetical protein